MPFSRVIHVFPISSPCPVSHVSVCHLHNVRLARLWPGEIWWRESIHEQAGSADYYVVTKVGIHTNLLGQLYFRLEKKFFQSKQIQSKINSVDFFFHLCTLHLWEMEKSISHLKMNIFAKWTDQRLLKLIKKCRFKSAVQVQYLKKSSHFGEYHDNNEWYFRK